MAYIKSRDIRIAVKREDGVEYLMNRFGLSNKEELFECIRRAIPSEADTLIKKFEKKHRQYTSRHENAQNSQEPVVAQSVESAEEHTEEHIDVVVHTAQELEALQDDKTAIEYPVMSVEELRAQEAELSAELCELEGKHKALVSERRGLCEDIAKAKRAIEELFRLANIQNERVQDLLTRYYQCDAEMTDNIATQRVYHELIDETRAQIVESEKITIFMYQNGSIEVENADVPQISDDEILVGFTSLLSNQSAGNLTINELKGVVKLQKMVATYTERGKNYELVFDNAKVQRVWETILA